ncbi:MAG: GyrI-like domain-containing protein [Pseudomonadota bacterium]
MTPDIVDLPEMHLCMAEATVPFERIPATLPYLYDLIHAALHDQGLRRAGPEQAYYQMGEGEMRVMAAVPAPEGFAPTDAVRLETIPAEKTLHLRHTGPFSGLPATWTALMEHAQAEVYGFGYSRELYQPWTPYPQERVTDVHLGISDNTGA